MVTDVEAQQQIITDLLRQLYGLQSADSWTARTITLQPTASGVVLYRLVEQRSDGPDHDEASTFPDDAADLVKALQQYMYNPTGGAWFSATFAVTKAGSGDATFNYTDLPDVPGADGQPYGMSPEEIAAHLRTFPRPSDTMPPWIQPSSS
ncbi:MAG: hypothetical protein ACRCTR_07155 [Actinomycetota bacterium]